MRHPIILLKLVLAMAICASANTLGQLCPKSNWGRVAMGVSLAKVSVKSPVTFVATNLRNLSLKVRDLHLLANQTNTAGDVKRRIDLSINTKPRIDALQRRYEDILGRLTQPLSNEGGDAASREKRFVGVFTAIAAGASAVGLGLYEMVSHHTMQEGIQQALHEAQSVRSGLEDLHLQTQKELFQIDQQMSAVERQLKNQAMITDTSFIFEAALNSVEMEIARLEITILRALDGKIDPLMYDRSTEQDILLTMRKTLEKKKLKLVDPYQLYHLSADVYFDNDALFYLFHVPVMPEELNIMCLERYSIHPHIWPEHGLIAELKPEKEFLAIDPRGRYQAELSLDDLMRCFRQGGLRMCSNALVREGPSGCLSALAFEDYQRAARECRRSLHQTDPYVY